MKLAFIGYQDSYHYNKIGGTDAFIRRISNYLEKETHQIYLLSYGVSSFEQKNISKNILQIEFITFEDMLKYIKDNEINNSISIYLKPIDRLKLFLFRVQNPKLIFHTYITVYNEKVYKRWILFSYLWMLQKNKKVFGSKTIDNVSKTNNDNNTTLMQTAQTKKDR